MLKRAQISTLGAALLLAMGGCSDSGRGFSPTLPDPVPEPPPVPVISMSVISSAPDQVSGGDARLALASDTEGALDEATLEINGDAVDMGMFAAVGDRLEGVVAGLALGENTLVISHPDHGELATLTLKNHPRQGPIFSGPQQQPFVCTAQEQLGVQPLVDADEAPGFPVYGEDGTTLVGYSRNCTVEPFTTYMYMSTDGSYKELPAGGERPADMATLELNGDTVDFVVRWERGTINRFIYSIAMLAEAGEAAGSLDTGLWNQKLVYRFQGGVGIGHTQGSMSVGARALQPDLLQKGYAIAYSTGNKMGEHYNMQVGGETALMVKERFIEEYGQPLYTVGLGASGGAIQQYVYGQNHPGLIDAGVPIQAYPDMVTQIIHIGDCELLEYFMDATDRDNTKWQTTANRSWLAGLHATDAVPDPLAPFKTQLGYGTAPGSTECIESWRGLTPLAMNPHYGAAKHQEQMVPPEQMLDVDWSHYDDLRNIYGEDEGGWPRTLYDNVGVQYGLQAMLDGNISAEEFLNLNATVGGWKQPKEMVQEGFPFLGSQEDVMADPSTFDPWSHRNMNHDEAAEVQPRTVGNLEAIGAAYESGMVFHGELDIPVIDWRPYLEHELDMHNTHQSFAIRQRMLDYDGDAGNQVVWFVDARPEGDDEVLWGNVHMALELLDQWMANIRANPDQSVAENRPAGAVDKCFKTDGSLIDEGGSVWDGIIDGNPAGTCTQYFETYSTSRIVAGAPIQGNVFKCALKSVDAALQDGTYGSWEPTSDEVARLKAIFPAGVCDYSKPDQGNPFAG